MIRFLFNPACAVAVLAVMVLSTSATGEAVAKLPVISDRTYVAGSAKLVVKGTFQINADIPINKPASISSDGMTWLQYGDSGAEAPNVLVTVSPYEVGIGVGLGKQVATAGNDICTGDMVVTATSITGHYKCPEVVSYDPRSGNMGKVSVEIHLTATS